MLRLEDVIISNLIYNEDYARMVVPFLDKRFFSEKFDSIVVQEACKFFNAHNKLPTKKILAIEITNRKDLSDSEFAEMGEYLAAIEKPENDLDWLIAQSETFFKKKSIYNAILDSIEIMDGKDKVHKEDAIPSLLSDALSFTFDKTIGHDYINDVESRFEFYHRVEERVPFDLALFNKITKGGLTKKTLSVAMASTGVGKSLFMCHMSSAAVANGHNVLYITMEMAEERIAERLDANLLNMTIDDLYAVDKQTYIDKFKKLKKKNLGKMVIKQYPTSSAHAGHFRSLLLELKTKKNFVPDIVFIDYLNICASQRVKMGAGANTYIIVKSIAEEIRALAVEFNVPIVSATQTNREGYNNTDIELTNTSESIGLPATVDFMFALISTEELEQLNQIMVKQLKNRYCDPSFYKKFVVGIDRAKMRLYDVENSAQKNLVNSGQTQSVTNTMKDKPVFDSTKAGNFDFQYD